MHQKKIITIIFLFITLSANPLFDINEGFKSLFWQHITPEDSLAYGNIGYLKIDSISISDSATLYYTRFGLPAYSWWRVIFKEVYFNSTLTVLHAPPSNADYICSNFSNAQWLECFERKDSVGLVRFQFPILPQGEPYRTYDYFSVLEDTCALQYQWIDDTTAVGTIMNNRHNNRSDGRTRLFAKSAIIVRLTDENPFRIKFIQIDSTRTDLVSLFMKYDFTKFTDDAKWYGIDFLGKSLFKVEKPRFLMIHKIFK